MTFDIETLQKRAGAVACVAAIARLLNAAKTEQKDLSSHAEYVDKQISESSEFLNEFGELTPFQEGAVLCVAEYLHQLQTTGFPDLNVWRPFSSETEDEIAEFIARGNATE